MVWDLPVPGGPCRTKLCPFAAVAMATICEESALNGTARSDGANFSSILPASIPRSSASQVIWPSSRLCTTLLLFKSSVRLRRSFHITNCPKEKSPRKQKLSTFQRFLSMTACRIVWNTSGRSMPCSSSGSGSRPPIAIP